MLLNIFLGPTCHWYLVANVHNSTRQPLLFTTIFLREFQPGSIINDAVEMAHYGQQSLSLHARDSEEILAPYAKGYPLFSAAPFFILPIR